MRKKLNKEEVRQFIESQGPDSKIYMGCDSTRYKKNGEWFADFALVVVVHMDGKHGCKIFGEIITEKDYQTRKGKPSYRLMQEAYKVSALYIEMIDVLQNRDVEIHLDFNGNPRYASNDVVAQAMGYIKGTCDITPKIKPDAFSASYAADRFAAMQGNI